jgi:CRP-like cAMP-binding protein
MAWAELSREGKLGPARTHQDRVLLAERGLPATVAFFLAEGTLEVFQPGADGASYLARLLVGPTVLCLKECLAGEETYLQTVRVLEKARLHAMTRAQVMAHLQADAAMTLGTLVEVSRAFCGAARLEGNRMQSTESLLAHALLAYADVVGDDVDAGIRLRVKRTQADWAECVGATERRVHTLWNEWKRQGFIDGARGVTEILDRDALLERIDDSVVALVHRGRLTTGVSHEMRHPGGADAGSAPGNPRTRPPR